MKTKKSKKKLKLNIPRTIVFVLFIYIVFYTCYGLYNQKVVHYNIEGNTLYSDAEILRTINLTDYPPILSINRHQIKKTLESDPVISKVEVNYGWHFYLNIKITENKPMFLLKSSGQAVLQDGTLVDNKNYLGIPTLLNDTPVEVRNLLAERLSKVDSGILYLISEIKYDPSYDSTNKIIDENRFLLYMNDTNTVYITARKANTLNYYLTIIANNEINEAGTLYLDGDENNYTFKLYSSVVKKEEE
ncbi:MAG: FtsQ-type POTRA domain-containing protein [Bacilli bacterium]|nr:FtsQ-type POTRA domain-containing protein [Bacilli bacterium]